MEHNDYENFDYLILASWHNGNIVDVIGVENVELSAAMYDVLYQYVRDLYNDEYSEKLTTDEKYWLQDNFFNDPVLEEWFLGDVYNDYVDPMVLSIKVLECSKDMRTIISWG